MVHLNDLDTPPTPLGSSPLYPRVPSHIHELGEMADKAKRRRKRFVRERCLHDLQRRHWVAIIEMAREHLEPESTQCFGSYEGRKECSVWLEKEDPLCQACVIVTKLMEVMQDE